MLKGIRPVTRRAIKIQQDATAQNLWTIARRLNKMPLDIAAKILTRRWLSFQGMRRIHPRVSSMILARMHGLDSGKALVVAQNIVSQLKINITGEQHLMGQGWVDLGIEILALGSQKVGSVDISAVEFTPAYKVHTGEKFHVIGSAPGMNEGILIALKFDPKHGFVK